MTQAEDRLLSVALTAAVEAGDHFRVRIGALKDVKTKSSPADLVTNVDPECEALIWQRVHANFPEHTLLGEEQISPGAAASVAATAKAAAADHLWIVDPLDGTTNFVHHMPLSVVSIAYACRGVVQMGVVFDPYHDELFFALKGQGAYCTNRHQAVAWSAHGLPQAAELLSHGEADGAQLHTLPGRNIQSSATQEIRQAIVASGFPARGQRARERTEVGLQVAARARHLRALGAAALHLAWVASGRIDGFWEYDLNVWDVAAGMLLVQEAGGQAAALGGGAYSLQVRDVRVAGTADLAAELDGALLM
ncbi:inositol monophosphatase [Alicyclobacillaceae bacterium I2511]|nr:inositol monophosphatase [Alicyclobacillaceae bacterium I2511]